MNIYDYRLSELKEYFKENNEKEFKAIQIYEWLYKKRIQSFDEMSNIKKETIELGNERLQSMDNDHL